MEEKDTKTITMPLSEYKQMVEENHNLRTQGIRGDVIKYVGLPIEEIKRMYEPIKLSLVERINLVRQERDYIEKRCNAHVRNLSILQNRIYEMEKAEWEYQRKVKNMEEEVEFLNLKIQRIKKTIKKNWWKFWK